MSNAFAALWASVVRTVTPLVVGVVVTWVTGLGVTLDAEFGPLLTTVVAGAISGVYYLVVRLLETYAAPKLGWLLGLAKSPAVYTTESPADGGATAAAVSTIVAADPSISDETAAVVDTVIERGKHSY